MAKYIKEKLKQRLFWLLLFVFAFFGIMLTNYILYKSEINIAKYQNELNLKQIKTCINDLKDINLTILEKINICADNSLTLGQTGDAFVVNLKDMKVIWDNSIDCKIYGTNYLTKNSICKYAKDFDSCIKLSKRMKQGYNGTYIWNFDGKPEITSWIILPNETTNFDGSKRSFVGIKDQIIIAQGAQLDEVKQHFELIKIFVNLIGFALLLVLATFAYYNKKE